MMATKPAKRNREPIQCVQVFGRKKTATAVAYCKRGNGNLRVNGRPLDMIEPRVLQYKLQEPILLLGERQPGPIFTKFLVLKPFWGTIAFSVIGIKVATFEGLNQYLQVASDGA